MTLPPLPEPDLHEGVLLDAKGHYIGTDDGYSAVQMLAHREAYAKAYAQAAVLEELERWKKLLHVRLDSTVMSKYANRAECEAARAALRNALLDVFGA